MKYLEFTFTTHPATEEVQDVLAAVLAEAGFDSFVHTAELDRPAIGHTTDRETPILAETEGDDRFRAYIQETLYNKGVLDEALRGFPLPEVTISYEMARAEDKDWNEEWERHYFQPIVVGGRCVVASTFHHDVPEAEYRITINPQMSFGTGHHATTSLMIGRLLDDDVSQLDVLDMGCGTSILAILARMRGARSCTAIDVDEWCVRNSQENIALNHLSGIDVRLGDASALGSLGPFDLIIANINLGILLSDLPRYAERLKAGGHIYLSGFYTEDIPQLTARAESLGLRLCDVRESEGWANLKLALPPGSPA